MSYNMVLMGENESIVYNKKFIEYVWGKAVNLEMARFLNPKERFFLGAVLLGMSRPENFYEYYLASEGNDGVEKMNDRFERVCEMTQKIWTRAEELNPQMHAQLVKDWDRGGEPAGEHEEENVPPAYFAGVAAVSTPAGWGAPRLILKLEEQGYGDQIEIILDDSLKESTDRAGFLCRLAENFI